MTTTPNLGLTVWQGTDNVTRANFNAQFQLIDQNAAARNQIGAASGIAGLDANQKLFPANFPVATATALGGVKGGSGINLAADGTISVTPYTLPVATASVLGGVKQGSNITIAADGTISGLAPYTLPSDVAKTDAAQTWTQPQIFNAALNAASSAPGSPAEGQQWYDTVNHRWKYYNGSVWVDPLKYQ